MPLTAPLTAEHVDAADLATRAGQALLALRAEGGHGLGARADRASHVLLVDELHRRYPDDPVRSEEGPASAGSAGRLWIVDPLDGTREYAEAGRDDWAVHVCLAVAGQPVAGAVALPALGITLSTPSPPAPAPPGPTLRLAVSRTRPPRQAQAVAAALGAELVPMGSAGAKVAAVIRGEVDAYVHAGGQYEWDSAAPVAVALAAGLHASRLDGAPLVYGAADPWLPDLLVCRPELRAPILDALGGRPARSGVGA